MVKEFGNSIDDSSEGGLGRCENASPSNAPGREMLEIMAVTVVMTRKIPRRILRKRLMGLKPRVGCRP